MLGTYKATWCNGCEIGRLNYYTKKGLRSSGPLRVVVIQTINISISVLIFWAKTSVSG